MEDTPENTQPATEDTERSEPAKHIGGVAEVYDSMGPRIPAARK